MSSPIPSLVGDVRIRIFTAVPGYWPGIGTVASQYVAGPIPEAMLCLGACQAAGGDPKTAIGPAAAITIAALGLRILDDLCDQDRRKGITEKIGTFRAFNLASTYQSLAFRLLIGSEIPQKSQHQLLETFVDGYLSIAAGQDRDLSNQVKDLEGYWANAEMKTGTAFATAAEAGAIAAGAGTEIRSALRRFGYHVGLAIQIFNDLDGTWPAEYPGDLERGLVTLPLIYGLTCEHENQALLERYANEGLVSLHAAEIRQILDGIETRKFLVWSALQHRQQGLEALADAGDNEGTRYLTDFFNGFFADLDYLLEENGQEAYSLSAVGQILGRGTEEKPVTPYVETPEYTSESLGMRALLRRAGL
ncbi:MAG: polyprenyl synthetase family protein [Bacteroidia bacterium]|nr:polyprenyl synthetase family protein [Bacteroidia bacterium]